MTNKLKVLTIFGTRPEAIKMAPLIKELEKYPEVIQSFVAVTAQHRQMLDQVLEVFEINVDYDLNIMKERQNLIGLTTRALEGLDTIIKEVNPNLVLVHGDTTTSFVASLAAYYNQVTVAHVEAGLRTWEKHSPFPEEINRQLTGVIADLHFTPTRSSYENLLLENKKKNNIYITGNTVIDALKTTVKENFAHEVLEQLGNDRFILLTAHRRENLGEPMKNMFRAVKRIVEEHQDIHVVFPVHLNPVVLNIAHEVFDGIERIHLIEPLSVIDFHNIASRAFLILTDSGGIQEEAPSFGVPVLIMRETTERPEGVEAGALKLVGTNEDILYQSVNELLNNNSTYNKMANVSNPYGDGQAAYRIVQAILYRFGKTSKAPDSFQ